MNLDHERFETFLYSMEDGLPQYLSLLEEEAITNRIPIVRKGSQSVIRFLLGLKKPKKILEVGTATGFSGLLMAEYSEEDTEIVTIEKMPKRVEKARENFKKYDRLQKITSLEGDATELLEKMAKEKEGEFDFIFMDAAKGQYLAFLPFVKTLLKKGGVLITDNLLQEGRLLDSRYTVVRRDRTIHKRMREYVKELFSKGEFETMLLESGDGMSVSIKL